LRFYVAENDATLTQGLLIAGQADADGEVDVTIGAGAASTTIIAGTLTMGSTAALTNAGLVAVANQSNITGVGTISSGTWQGTAIAAGYIADAFLKNDASDTTTGTITAGGFTTTGTWTFDEYSSGTIGITTVQDSGTTFNDNDTSLMTAAAIADKIEAYSYSTTTGTVTSVAITGTDGIDVDSGSAITGAGTITLGLSSIANSKLANSAVTIGSTSISLGATSTTLAGITALSMNSSSANEPILNITNTHTGATSGELRFNKDSASGDDSDIMGLISFYGTDAGEATHERLAYIDSIVTDSAAGSEAASLRFYVAENDANLTQGLLIAGQADDDGEVDVTIGAGAASTTIIAGTLTMGSTAALTNAGLVAVANQSNITGTSALSSGSITSGFGAIDNGSSNITTTGTLDISGGTLTLAANQISGDKVEGGTIAATIITALTTAGITATANIDIGAYDLRAATVTADGLTSGRVVFAGTAGVLSSDADLTFSGDTLTATKLKVSDGGTIGSATDADVITIAAEGDVTFSKATKPAAPAAASGTSGIVVLDCNTTNHFTITTSGNITGWNFTNASPGQRIIVRVTNGASHTVAFSATGDGDVVYFPGGTEPTLTVSGGIDVYGFLCIAADTFDGFIIGQDIKA
jgi:hypothetical protein